MKTSSLIHFGARWPCIFVLGILLGLIQGCGRREGAMSSEQREELLALLRQAGVKATFMSECYQPPVRGNGYYQVGGQGFILRLDHLAGELELTPSGITKSSALIIARTPSGLTQAIGPIIEKYVKDKGLDYQFVHVELGRGFQPTSFKIYLQSAPSSAGRTSALSKTRFNGSHVFFDYPQEWSTWDEESFGRVKRVLESQGVELLVLFKMVDDGSAFTVTRNLNPSTFEQFYKDKKEIADRVTNQGVEIMGERYTKYSVKKTLDFGDDARTLLSQAEKPGGETAISYQFLSDNYEYNINFIYPSRDTSERNRTIRKQLLRTFKILDSEER